MKRAIWVIVVFLVAAALALGAYWFFNQRENGEPLTDFSVRDFFPFGQAPDSENFADSGSGFPGSGSLSTTTSPNLSNTGPITARLWRISGGHQAGAGVFEKNGTAYIRFVDTATGNIFENELGTNMVMRVSNTTIPKINEALWLPDGNSVILRYLSDSGAVQTLHADIVESSEAATDQNGNGNGGADLYALKGAFLPANISSMALFGPRERVFFITRNTNGTGGSAGFTAETTGARAVKIFDTPIHEWTASWPRENTIIITSKPSANSLGFSYIVSSTNGSMERLLGGIAGLSINISLNLERVVYSESTASGARLNAVNLKTRDQKRLAGTLAEKCLWLKDNINLICAVPKNLPNATYPDNWYDGSITFSDTFWRINTDTGEAQVVLDPRDIGAGEIDAIKLVVDSAENILVFTNKKDSTLWGLRIAQ